MPPFVCELDGTRLKMPIARKQVKIFKRGDKRFTPNDITSLVHFDFDEVKDMDALKQDEDI